MLRTGKFRQPSSASSEIGGDRSGRYLAQDSFADCRGQRSFRRARFRSGDCETWRSEQRDRDTALLACEQRCVPQGGFQVFLHYYLPDKPISSVTVDLGDYSRRVSVTGEAADQIHAITNLLENDLLRHSTTIGGAMFRRVAGMCLLVAFLTSFIFGSAYWWNTRRYSALGMLVCSALGLLLVLLVPWDRYLPGFALYQSYSPFLLIRYSAPILFLSLIAAFVGIPLSYFLPRWRRKT